MTPCFYFGHGVICINLVFSTNDCRDVFIKKCFLYYYIYYFVYFDLHYNDSESVSGIWQSHESETDEPNTQKRKPKIKKK